MPDQHVLVVVELLDHVLGVVRELLDGVWPRHLGGLPPPPVVGGHEGLISGETLENRAPRAMGPAPVVQEDHRGSAALAHVAVDLPALDVEVSSKWRIRGHASMITRRTSGLDGHLRQRPQLSGQPEMGPHLFT